MGAEVGCHLGNVGKVVVKLRRNSERLPLC